MRENILKYIKKTRTGSYMFVVERIEDWDRQDLEDFIKYDKFLFIKPDRLVLDPGKSLEKNKFYNLTDYDIKTYKDHDYISEYFLEEYKPKPKATDILFLNIDD